MEQNLSPSQPLERVNPTDTLISDSGLQSEIE